MSTFKQSAELRASKREASRRCRARQKTIANGELITPELAIRSAQPHAMNLDNFKMRVGDKIVRLNRNGGEKIAMSITEDTENGVVRTRKSFSNLSKAVKAFTQFIMEA